MSWNRRSAGRPPTLWWVLIFWAAFVSDVALLDDVGVERALGQEVDPAPSCAASSSKTRMNSSPMIWRFSSGSSTPASRARNRSRASTITRFMPEVALEGHPQQLRLLLAHEAVVDVDAGQPIAHGAMDERRGNGRIDAAGQRADDLAVRAGRRAWASTRSRIAATVDSMKLAAVQVGSTPGDADHEVAQDVPAARRVHDLGMELDAVEVALAASARPAKGVESVCAVDAKPSGSRVIESPWLIQTGCSRSKPGEQAVLRGDRDVRRAVLALGGRQDVAAELVRHQLRAVADAEDRDAAAPDRRIGLAGRRRHRRSSGRRRG